jgi:hypothetical protein
MPDESPFVAWGMQRAGWRRIPLALFAGRTKELL